MLDRHVGFTQNRCLWMRFGRCFVPRRTQCLSQLFDWRLSLPGGLSVCHGCLTGVCRPQVDSRYTTTTQLVKLVGSHTISRILLRIGDLKRSKMVRTINVYYNNRTVQSVVELKNRPCESSTARRYPYLRAWQDCSVFHFVLGCSLQ